LPRLDPGRYPFTGPALAAFSAVAAGAYFAVSRWGPLGPAQGPLDALGRAAGLAAAFMIPPIAYLRLAGGRAIRIWAPRAGLRRDIAAGLVMGLLLASMNGMAIALGVQELPSRARSGLELATWRAGTPGELAMVLLAVGVVAPVAEEVFFRGVLYPSLRRSMPVVPSIVLTSAAFGATHLEALRTRAALLGVLAAILVEYTGSLVPAILAHAGVNVSFVLFLAGGGALSAVAPLWPMAAAFVVLNGLLFALGKTLFGPPEDRASAPASPAPTDGAQGVDGTHAGGLPAARGEDSAPLPGLERTARPTQGAEAEGRPR